ncbi:hypothetical protein [Saccharothrix variisporea]|uniref:DUF3168 domain-containing protein n=1 Tax=Saccharothrix variisporea TaxID=543527 RepID=A0A495WZR2_9PSEU|nr:hypothetical protein [Saccharothrix variisporea]RKT67110.1 hypothetical protein DFJ66_0278 [Saccharothrix variisporea]
MATGTATIDLIAGLVALLSARPGLATVQVADAYPTSGLQNEAIWAEDAESDAEFPVMKAGTKKVDETVTTDWVIQVLMNDGSDQITADRRAAEIFGEFQQQLAESPQVVDAVMWAELASWRLRRGQLATGGHGSRYEIALRHKARLSP